MGCDIHAYVDYDEKVSDDGEHRTYNLARISIGRNYWLFTLLAGVRGNSVQGQFPVTARKGLPPSISWRVQHDAFLTVIDAEEVTEAGCCTRADAERWGGKYTDDTKRCVHHPDWHSHSWLTVEEVDEVIRRFSMLKEKKQIFLQKHEAVPEGYTLEKENWGDMKVAVNDSANAEVPMEMLAIRAMMGAVESTGRKCRFVFWFDN